MKLSSVINDAIWSSFVLASFLGLIAMSHADESTGAQKNEMTPAQYLRSFSRKVDIPIAPASSGISSGLVIVYGHPLPPPYKFERRGSILYVNNVEADPSLVQQREHAEMRKHQRPITSNISLKYAELEQFEHALRKEYFDKKGKEPDDQLHAEILAEALTNSLIRDAHWETPTRLGFKDTFSGYDVPTGVLFLEDSLHNRPHKIWSQKAIDEEMRTDIQGHENWLKDGGCFFFTGMGPWQGQSWQCKDIKTRVAQIMSQPNLSQDQKEKRLTQLFRGDENAALDILLNFKESEWK